MTDEIPKTKMSKKINRRLSRVRESFLQSLGKSFKTRNEEFDSLCIRFTILQSNSLKYQKALKQYCDLLQRLMVCNKMVMNAIWDIYDPNWLESDQIQVKTEIMEKAFQTYVINFESSVLDPLQKYLSRMDDLSSKIYQRDRHLLDLDASKSELARRENAKQRNSTQIEKATQESEKLRIIYENLNNELLSTFPDFFSNRLQFFGHNLKNMFSTSARFHQDFAEMMLQLTKGMEVLNVSGYRKSILDSNLSDDSSTKASPSISPDPEPSHSETTNSEQFSETVENLEKQQSETEHADQDSVEKLTDDDGQIKKSDDLIPSDGNPDVDKKLSNI